MCLRRRASPRFTAPCTTHNREVPGSNPGGAIPRKPRYGGVFSVVRAASDLPPANSMEAFWKRKRRCRLQNANVELRTPEPERVARSFLLGGKLPGGRELVQRIDALAVAGHYRLAGIARLDVGLPHAGHEEDLVVHRQPEQDPDQQHRQEADDRPRRATANRSARFPSWKIQTVAPIAAPMLPISENQRLAERSGGSYMARSHGSLPRIPCAPPCAQLRLNAAVAST